MQAFKPCAPLRWAAKVLALATEVLEDLGRQHDGAPASTRKQWVSRKERLERLE